MSYTKTAATTGENPVAAFIRFHYLTDSLFNEISVLTQYRAKNIKDNAGKSLSDDFAISENERDIFKIDLKYTINDIFAELVKQTKGITNSIFIDSEITITPAEGETPAVTGKASGFSVVDHGAFNDNNLTLIDSAIQKAAVNSILRAWYKHCGLQTDMQLAELDYNTALLAINQRMFELKKKLMTE